MLLPASVLSRRAYSAQIIFGVLVLKARGWGHRRIGESLKLPVTTVREWIRRMGSRLDRARAVFRKIGREVRTDQPGEPEDGESRSLWQQMIDGLVQGIGQSPEHATGGDTDQQIIDVLLKAMSECENAEHTSGEGPARPGGGGDVDQPGGEVLLGPVVVGGRVEAAGGLSCLMGSCYPLVGRVWSRPRCNTSPPLCDLLTSRILSSECLQPLFSWV